MRPPRRLIAMPALVSGLLVFGLLVFGLAIASSASASLILALDLPTLVARADQISVVDVVSVKASWNEDHDRIVTTVDLAVVDCWKGSAAPASHVQVVQPGGTVAELTMRVDGMPRFSPGERALLFLRFSRDRPGRASVVGMGQGKRPVQREAGTGRWMVSAPDRAGADFVTTTPASGAVFTARARPLADLKSEIHALAAGASGGAR
jgi:hypothetical protein